MGKLSDVLKALFTPKREVSLPMAFDQLAKQLYDEYPDYYIKDIYLENNGSMSVVCIHGGKLYKSAVTFADGKLTAGEPYEVEETFVARGTNRIGVITREGEPDLWYIIASVAVVNRDGELDSTQLYENFIQRAEESETLPFLTFYHLLDPKFNLGTTKFIARDGYVYLNVGTWADTEFAQAVKRSVQEDPAYWGASIRFLPLGNGEVLRSKEGIEIPVLTDGIHIETSILPEAYASSWFTKANTEVIRMNKKIEEALRKIFGDDAKVKAWGEEIDQVNRTIESDPKIIARAEATEEKKDEEEKPEETPTETTPSPVSKELVDAVIAALQEGGYISREQDTELIAAALRRVDALETLMKDAAEDLNTLATTIEHLSQDEEARRREWTEDLTTRTAGGGQRPRERYYHHEDETEPMSLAETASQTLETIEQKK